MKRLLAGVLMAVLSLSMTFSLYAETPDEYWGVPYDCVIPVKSGVTVTGYILVSPDGKAMTFEIDGRVFESARVKYSAAYGKPISIEAGKKVNIRNATGVQVQLRGTETDPTPYVSPRFEETVSRVRQRYQSGEFGDEVFLLANYSGEGFSWDTILYHKDGQAVAECLVENRFGDGVLVKRAMSVGEWTDFCDYVDEMKVDRLSYQFGEEDDAHEYQYLHISPEKEYAFYMYDPPFFTEQARLVNTIDKLADSKTLYERYQEARSK